MADNDAFQSPPSATAGAPGYTDSNGQPNAHMPPPPLPPVIIPQNTNPIPTAISSPMSGNVMSPASAGGTVRRAAPEPNKRALYVGGLDPRVTEEVLRQIFETTGHVQSVKIIPDKNVSVCNRLLREAHVSSRRSTRTMPPTSDLCQPRLPEIVSTIREALFLTFLSD